jgi:predicted transcriptional regulator
MKAKIEELKKSRELRQQGHSVREIAKILNVSKGSVSAWVRDVQLTEEQQSAIFLKWKEHSLAGSFVAGKLNKAKYMELRNSYQKEGRELARLKDPDFFAGCMLYWGEGTKNRNKCQITNSDPNLLLYFIGFLKRFFNVKNEDIRIGCHYYTCNGLNSFEVEQHWIKQLGLPKFCFVKTSTNHLLRTSGKKRQERTKYGVVKVNVHNVRIVQMIYGAIQEIASFKNKEWVE